MPAGSLWGRGVFARNHPDFATDLQRFGLTAGDYRLAARNFLLDEGVSPHRAAQYRAEAGSTSYARVEDWKVDHAAYLGRQWDPPATGAPADIDPARAETCPSTFHDRSAYSPLGADLEIELAQFADVGEHWFTKDRSPLLPTAPWQAVEKLMNQALTAVAKQHATTEKDRDEYQQAATAIQATFDNWLFDPRPAYVALWEDVRDLFGDDPTADQPDWVNDLRDRLGLKHFNPADRSQRLPIIAFKYKVRATPGCGAPDGRRPLMILTVLDTGLSDAFCPVPAGQPAGRTVDLRGLRDSGTLKWVRELLHPCLPYRVEHLFRAGWVEGPAPADLARARTWHLRYLRQLHHQKRYARGTG